MYINRKAGLALAALVAFCTMAPAMADNATTAAKANVDQAIGTVNSLKQFFSDLKTRQDGAASASAGSGTTVVEATFKCPICGMTMTAEVSGGNTHAVKIGGKTWYCCACNMSSVADKAAATPAPRTRRRRAAATPSK